MFVPRVRDEETDTTYQLDRLLGEGATSQVYLGMRESGSGPAEAAIKIARRGMSTAGIDAFWDELDILRALSNSDAHIYVPWAHKGIAPDRPEINCIIIEYIPDTLQLTRQALTPGGPIPESLAISAGIQYARLLTILHTLRISSFGDRKSTDLRWDGKRLIVLDWNRARVVKSDTPQEVWDNLVRQDLRVFSEIWSQLMLGQSLNDLPDIDDTTNPAWAHLRRGARAILSRARAGRSSMAYQAAGELTKAGEAGELAKALETHEQLLALGATKPDELLAHANQSYQDARAETRAGKRADLIEQVLTIADLAVRADRVNAEQIEPIYAWCREQGTRAVREARKAADQIRRQLQLGYYPQALKIAADVKESFGPDDTEAKAALLIMGRWEQIARAGMRGNESDLLMDDIITPLVTAMASAGIDEIVGQPSDSNALYTYRVELKGLLPTLAEVERQVPDDIQALFVPVRQEIEIRQSLAQATQAAVAGDEANSRVGFQQATSLWHELGRSNPPYAKHLRLVLTMLDTQLESESHATLQDHEINRRKQQFVQRRQALLHALDAALPQRIWPPDLAAPLDATIATLRELIAVWEPEPAIMQEYDAICDLRAADDLMGQDRIKPAIGEVEVIEAAFERIERMKTPAFYERSLACWRCEALRRVQQTLNQKPVWPDDLNRATALMGLIGRKPLPIDDRQLTEELGALSRDLEAKRGKLAELRDQLGALAGDVSLVVQEDYLDNLEIDRTLQDAQEAGIELFDSQVSGEGRVKRQHVAALLADRQTARIPLQMKRVISEMAGLRDQIQNDWKALEDPITKLIGALTQFTRYTDFLSTPAHLKARQAMEDEVRILETLNDNLEVAMQVVEQIPEREKRLQQSTSSEVIARLRKYTDEAGRISQQFRQTEQQLHDVVQPAWQAMIVVWVSAGLQAVRDLRLDGPDGARMCLSRAQTLIGDHGAHDPIQETLQLLKRALEHLDALQQRPDQWQALQTWREALLRRDVETAEPAWAKFMHVATADILSLWVIGEMRAEQAMLRRVMPGSSQQLETDSNKQLLLEQLITDRAQKVPTREQQEQHNYTLKQIADLEQMQKTNDRPERLGEIRVGLEWVRQQYSIFDQEVVERYDSLRDWYESRQKAKEAIEGCEMAWSNCQESLDSRLDYLKSALLPYTERLVATTLPNIPSPYWKKLYESLELAYTRLAKYPKDVPISTIIWLGFLYHRVRELKSRQPEVVVAN